MFGKSLSIVPAGPSEPKTAWTSNNHDGKKTNQSGRCPALKVDKLSYPVGVVDVDGGELDGNTQPQSQPQSPSPSQPQSQSQPKEDVHNSRCARLLLQKNMKLVERRKTILSLIIRNQRLFGKILSIYKHPVTTMMITLVWLVCHINVMSICFKAPLIPNHIYVPLQLIFTTNFCILNFVFIRVDIVKYLATSFNFWFTVWSIVSFHTCYILLWGASPESFSAVAHSLSSIVLLILFDAHSRKHLLVMKVASILGTLSYIPLTVVSMFRLVEFQNEVIYYRRYGDFEIINVRLQAVDNLVTLIVYLLRINYNHIISKNTNTVAFLSDFYEIDEVQIGSNPPDEIRNRNMKKASASFDMKNIDPQKYILIGIMESKIIDYDTSNTLYAKVITHRFLSIKRWMKSSTYGIICAVINVLATVSSFVFGCGFNMGEYVQIAGVIMTLLGVAFLLMQMIILCNSVMIRYILHTFDYWYVMYLSLKILVSTGVLYNWDFRMIFCFYMVLTVNWCVMIDSFPFTFRKLSYLAIVGSIWMISAAVLCKLNLGKTFEYDKSLYLLEVQFMSSRVSFSNSIFSVAVFLCRFFWSYFRNSSRILFITENISIEEIKCSV